MPGVIVPRPIRTTTTPAPRTEPTPPTPPKDPMYGSRWERSYALSYADADRLQAVVAKYVPFDRQYPNPQRIQTVYVRTIEDKGPKEDFRIRTYPDSPGPPTLLEFKDTVVKDGKKYKEKVRIPVSPDINQRLLWGESGADVIGRDGRTGADLIVANRAINVVDNLKLRPVVRQEYNRTTYEDGNAGVRVTFDRNIHYTGIGELIRAGSNKRDHAIMDIKVLGQTPDWLSGLVDAETAAKTIVELKDGKGTIAVNTLKAQLPPPYVAPPKTP